MKNLKRLFLLILLVLFCSSCGSSSNLKSLSYKEFKEKIKNEDTFFLVVIRDGCQHCEKFVPKVEEVVDEYNIIGYTLNYSDLSEDEDEEFYNQYVVDGTPTTIFFKDGKDISILQRLEGNVSKEKLIDKLKKNDYIK